MNRGPAKVQASNADRRCPRGPLPKRLIAMPFDG